jgi:hypothetical protein
MTENRPIGAKLAWAVAVMNIVATGIDQGFITPDDGLGLANAVAACFPEESRDVVRSKLRDVVMGETR